jgi:hypothetical protein
LTTSAKGWRSFACVGAILQGSATLDKLGERFGVVQKDAGLGHLLVIGLKLLAAVLIGDELKLT